MIAISTSIFIAWSVSASRPSLVTKKLTDIVIFLTNIYLMLETTNYEKEVYPWTKWKCSIAIPQD